MYEGLVQGNTIGCEIKKNFKDKNPFKLYQINRAKYWHRAGSLNSIALLSFFFNFFFLLSFSLAVLGLRCCTWAFSSCGKRGPLFVAVRRLLIAVASLAAEHGHYARGFSTCGARA